MNCDRNFDKNFDRNAVAAALRLYAVTDRAWSGQKGAEILYRQVEQAIRGGVTLVQLREKNIGKTDFLKEAKNLVRLCHSYGVPLIINDSVEVAVESGADGVHVGQEDMEAEEVRGILGRNKILGVSAHSLEEAKRAEAAGADYLGVGAVFGSRTKKDASPVSYEILRQICENVSIPVVAIGGITKGNLNRLAGSGVQGVALVSAIFGAGDIEEECRELAFLSEKMIFAGRE